MFPHESLMISFLFALFDDTFMVCFSRSMDNGEVEERILRKYSLSSDADRKKIRRFLSTVSKLEHPALVRIHGFFFENSDVYVEMPYFKLGTLSRYQSPLSL